MKFDMCLDMLAGMFREGKDEWWAQFDGPRMNDYVP